MKNSNCASALFKGVLVTLLLTAPTVAHSAECAGKSVAQCADALAQKVDDLITANKVLSDRVSKTDEAEKVLQSRVEALEAQIRGLRVTLTTPTVRNVQQSEFWNPNPINTVSYTCPSDSVLVGMEFDMWSHNDMRSPARVQYMCKKLSP